MTTKRAAYQRGYNKTWKEGRRTRLLEMLGGCCARCGTKDDLEFDHIDPSAKRFTICAALSKAWADLVEEASRCQLLCKPCHVAKGAEDRPEPTHGTYYVYWYYSCRCDPCKAANTRKSAVLRAKKIARPAAGDADGGVNGEFSVAGPEDAEGPEAVFADQGHSQLPRQDSNLEHSG
jgi:hypothetical protein